MSSTPSMADRRRVSASSSTAARSSSAPARPTTTAASASSEREGPGTTGSCSTRRRRSSAASSWRSSSPTATTTSRCSSLPTRARPTAAANGRRARGALRRAHPARRAARRARGSARRGPRRDRAASRGGQGRRPRGPSAHRRAVAGAARRGSGRPGRARVPEPGLRGEARLSLRRLREPPIARRAAPSPAGAAATNTRGRARDRPRGARRDRARPVAPRMSLAVDPYLWDWGDLLFRWLHVIAAIVWIGTSFYFVALDNHLLPPRDPRDADRGIGGETWEIHGGGFYRIEKFRVAPRTLPEPLHWFKWEAYTTWLSGFALLIVLYYVHASSYLIDKSVADLSTGEAVAISVALLAASWVVYDVLCRRLRSRPLVLAAVLLGLITLSAWGVAHLFSGRAVYIQIGAMIWTMMVGNVLFAI